MSALLDVEMIHITVYILLLTHQTRVWNKKVENFKPDSVNDDDIVEDNEMLLEEIYFNFECITEAWNLIKKSAELFGKLEYLISHAVGMLLLLTKDFFVETGLCVASETFYEETDRVNTNVILKLAQDLPSKKIWKNIFRVLDVEFCKLNALNMFVVDAATQLHYCNLVTTYIIVLLQFAFLH
ncbi:unnamed protein product [Spodoptera exigua]|nr:unnamed protein product [Spodoptera exigua]